MNPNLNPPSTHIDIKKRREAYSYVNPNIWTINQILSIKKENLALMADCWTNNMRWKNSPNSLSWQDWEVRRLSASRSADSCHPKRHISFRTSCICNAGYPVLFFRIVSIPCNDSKDIPLRFPILVKIVLLFRRCASFSTSSSLFFGDSAYRKVHRRKGLRTFPSM